MDNKTLLYCYVDECGQDTMGKVFIVAVVVTSKERDTLLELCGKIEKQSGKGILKWRKAGYKQRLTYLQRIFAHSQFKGKIIYSISRDTKLYDSETILAIAEAVHWGRNAQDYATIIYVDGLEKAKCLEYGPWLRKLGIFTRKVQGVKKDENNALIRLADAAAGFVRDSLEEGQVKVKKLLERAISSGMLVKIQEKP